MKKIIIIAAALLAINVAAAQNQMPDVQVETHEGTMISTATLLEPGTPMIVSFWSTTCKPCIMELNAINSQLEEWLEEADFRIVAVSTDDSRTASKARTLASGNGWNDFTLLYDKNQDFKRALNVNLVPQVFIFDATGKIVYSHTGYTPGSEVELLEKILAL